MSNSNSSPAGHRWRMDPGSLGLHIVDFTNHLIELGHTELTVLHFEGPARHFGQWLHGANIDIEHVDDNVVEQFAQHQCQCAGKGNQDCLSIRYVRRVRKFVQFLARRGVVKREAAPGRQSATTLEPVRAFEAWLRRHRGISELTSNAKGAQSSVYCPLWETIQSCTTPDWFGE
jgi:integrase/recombinase XerD